MTQPSTPPITPTEKACKTDLELWADFNTHIDLSANERLGGAPAIVMDVVAEFCDAKKAWFSIDYEGGLYTVVVGSQEPMSSFYRGSGVNTSLNVALRDAALNYWSDKNDKV